MNIKQIISLNSLVSEAGNVGLRELGVRRGIYTRVCCTLLREPYLGLVVYSEVGQLCLDTNSDLLADVGHLKSLLPEVPLVPAIVGLDVFLNEMCWGLHTLVHH